MEKSNLFFKLSPILFFFCASLTAGQAPLVNADYYSTNWSTTLNVAAPGVLSNDYDDNSLTAQLLVAPEQGELTLNADGSFTYQPVYGFYGDVTFQYAAFDGENQTIGTVYLHLTIGNQAPVAATDYYDIAYGDVLNANPGVLANDHDAEGDTMTATLIDPPAEADVFMDADGSFLFEPRAGVYGVFTMTYEVSDGNGSSTGQIHVTVKSPNAPHAGDDFFITDQNTPVILTVLDNDVDGDNDPLRLHSVSQTPHGANVINANGTITFTPAPGFSGEAMFSYAVTDGLEFGFATVWVQVNASTVNHAPVAGDDRVNAVVNTPLVINVLANDVDPDGDALTVTLPNVSNARFYQVNADQTVTFTPPTGYIGPMEMGYFISDGIETDVGVITLFVGGNHAPIAVPDEVTTTAGTPVVIDVMANDIEPDGQPFYIQNVTGAYGIQVSRDAYLPITVTPDPGFVGDAVFQYTIIDQTYLGQQRTATTTVTVHVVGPQTNEAPVAVADAAAVVQNGNVTIAVLGNDSDPDGDSLAIASLTQPAHGTLIWQPGYTAVTYFPTREYLGQDSFTYTVTDGAAVATAVVTVEVVPSGEAPIAIDDVITVQANSRMNILDLAKNDIDMDGSPLYILTIGRAPNGTLSQYTGPTGPFIRWETGTTLAYTPDPGFVGTDSFTYTVGDGFWFGQEQQTGTVTIHVVE